VPEGQLTLDDFIPVVGKNYINPHLLDVPASVYKNVNYSRAVLLIPKTPTTSGIVYIYAGAFPANDLASIPIPAGNNVYLDARGEWYIKTSSGVTETFLVVDAGAAANAAAIMNAFGTTPAPTPPPAFTMAAPGVNADIDNASEEVVAAAAARRYLYIENTSTGGQVLWLAFGATAVVGSGIRLSPGQHYELLSPTGITVQAVNAIADAANGSASYQTGT